MKLFALYIAVVALPLVLATNGRGTSCPSNQFQWKEKDCCLEYGPPPQPETPPKGSDCPSNWSWRSEKGCCAPHQPPHNLPPPQCNHGWRWSDVTFSCCPNDTPSTTTSHLPPSASPRPTNVPGSGNNNGGHGGSPGHNGGGHSGGPGNGGGGKGGDEPCDDEDTGNKDGDHSGKNNHKRSSAILKRKHRSRAVSLCPRDLTACPVSSLANSGFDCADTVADLENCGGCAVTGQGQNCNAIEGAWNVACEAGSCKVYTCESGYKLDANTGRCLLD